jgi:hypothetical protein
LQSPTDVGRSNGGPIDAVALLPWAVPIVVVLVLSIFAAADPTAGVTGSASPFTDEGWNLVNARNFVLLGRWSTDQFNLHLVNGPFGLAEAASFAVLGVGIVQGRLVSIVAVGLLVLLLTVGLRPVVGRGAAIVAGAALGASTLVLFYGRLAYTEPLMMLALTAGALTVVKATGMTSARWGLLGGVLFGAAIATKANAAIGAGAFWVAIAAVDGRRSDGVRRWLGGILAGLGIVTLGWTVVVFVPNRDAVLTDIAIWPHQQLPAGVGELVRRVASYPFRSDGGVPALLPLGIGALVGVVAGVGGWSSLSPTMRRLFVGSLAWVVLTLAVLVVLSYRPNRYLLPVIPALAILVGIGASAFHARLGAASPGARRSVAALALAGLCLPGVVSYASWMSHATFALPAAQASVAAALPPGQAVEGRLAPLLAMRAPVVTIVPWQPARANLDDHYAHRDVRWVVTGDGVPPAWIGAHPEAWAARREQFCLEWGGDRLCLVELP